MLCTIGVTGILGCGAIIAGLVIGAVSIAASCIGTAVTNAQAEQQHQEMLDLQEQKEDEAEADLKAQKMALARQNERKHVKNMMAMGTSVAMQQISSRNTKIKITKTYAEMNKMNGSKSSNKKVTSSSSYPYGNPQQSSGQNQQQAQS